jgi:hypothetical protein
VRSAWSASSSRTTAGSFVNPDGLRHQIEGNVIQGISRTLREEVHYARDQITTLLWQPRPGSSAHGYSVLRFSEVPAIKSAQVVTDKCAGGCALGEDAAQQLEVNPGSAGEQQRLADYHSLPEPEEIDERLVSSAVNSLKKS